jgi:hypothetical protein
MFGALAVNWVFLVLRASIAMMFGTIAVVWPGLTSVGLVLLFGAYVLSDGVLALCVALSVKGLPGFGSLLFESSRADRSRFCRDVAVGLQQASEIQSPDLLLIVCEVFLCDCRQVRSPWRWLAGIRLPRAGASAVRFGTADAPASLTRSPVNADESPVNADERPAR